MEDFKNKDVLIVKEIIMKHIYAAMLLLLIPLTAHVAHQNTPLNDFKGGPKNEQHEKYNPSNEPELSICETRNNAKKLKALSIHTYDVFIAENPHLPTNNLCQWS